MSQAPINLYAIRPINGSRDRGFEHLCSQLAEAETPDGAEFERKGTPDAGVECYAIFKDGSEWGWQAKFFNVLGDSQWQQLDKSVRTALEKHPRLVRYYICIPIDLPDARIPGQTSAKDRWKNHLTKWSDWASARNMTVEFIYWGEYQILKCLGLPQNIGWVRFWFDVQRFDNTWFTARLEEAIENAGPRYTPEIHVALPIAYEFEAFGRTEEFFNRIKAQAKGIRKSLQTFQYSDLKAFEQPIKDLASDLSFQVQAILTELSGIKYQPVGILPFERIAKQLLDVEDTVVKDLWDLLLQGERECDAKSPVTEGCAATSIQMPNPFRECRYRLSSLSSKLQEAHKVVGHAAEVAGRSLMLLEGAAGTGKTHLLCDVAKQRIAAGLPTILLMGQCFIGMDAPWTQALHQLDLSNLSTEEFVGALEAAAQVANQRALVLRDAINEGNGRLIWPNHLPAFLLHLARSPWVGVLLSVRSSYVEFVVPDEVRSSAVAITHSGFTEYEYDATKIFFTHYGLELPSTPLLAPEFSNPLFLKTICQGLQLSGQHRMPRGFQGITNTFKLFLNAINKRLAERLSYNPKNNLVSQALEAFTGTIVTLGKQWLPLAKAQEVINNLLPERDFGHSLFHALVSDRILVEEAVQHKDGYEEVVFIGYERFADHLIADTLLNKMFGVKKIRIGVEKISSWFWLNIRLCWNRFFHKNDYWRLKNHQKQYASPGLLEALCVQVPERTGYELSELFPVAKEQLGFASAFRQSLIWRSPTAFSKSTLITLNQLIRTEYDNNDTLDALLTVTTLPEHPYNANFLDGVLRKIFYART